MVDIIEVLVPGVAIPGPANELSIGTVMTGGASSASISGSYPDQKLNLVLQKGDKGDGGDPGNAATIAVGSVTTLAPGASATVNNSGTVSVAVLDFGIPRGSKGDAGNAATIAVGTVTTGAAGSSASVSNVGTSAAAVLNFTIPRGDTGLNGADGASVMAGDGAPVFTAAAGDIYIDVSTGDLYRWEA